jgi:hypothetical protein
VFRSVQSNLATDLGTSPGKVADLNEVGSRATDALHYDAAPQLAFSAPYPPKAKTREIIKLAEGRPAQKIKPAGLDADGLSHQRKLLKTRLANSRLGAIAIASSSSGSISIVLTFTDFVALDDVG